MRRRLTLKDPQREIHLFNQRTIVLSLIIGMLIVILIARLWYLQVKQHRLYKTLSQQNQLNLLPIEPNRGLIYDRHGILLAENVPVFSLEIVPSRINSVKTTIAQLAQIVSLTERDQRQFYKQLKQNRRLQSVPLRTRLTEQEVARLAVEQYRFPGVVIKARMVRTYPFSEVLVPVLGYVGRINEQDLAKIDQNNYSATNYIGKLGIERYFEHELHGKVGYQQAEMDATGRIVRVLSSTPSVPGKNLQLTIDNYLQQVAEAALGEQQGAVVAIQPATGQILAIVSNPGFDPNYFVDGISTKDFKALQQNPAQPLYNRAIRGQYPPGSTIKPIMALAGLEAGIITPDFSLFDPGWFQLKTSSHIYHDWKRTGHGKVDLNAAIMNSCDTYFYTLAHKMGIHRIDNILARFGYGTRTGIEMHEELPGLLPTPAWKKRTQGHTWYPGDTLITGIGQGYLLATPLQMAVATAIIAMRGKSMQPTLIFSTQMPGQSYVRNPAKPLPIVFNNTAAWQPVIDGMRAVMTNGTGLAHYGKVAYDVAGKTGTAQVYSLKQNERYNASKISRNLRDNSLFIAFAPVENPEIALAVMVEHSTEAAGIARKVMDYYLYNRGKAPQLDKAQVATSFDDQDDDDDDDDD